MSNVQAKKPFYTKWWVWLLAVIIVIAIASGGEDTVDSTTSEPDTSTKEQEVTESSPLPNEKEAETVDEPKEEVVEAPVEEVVTEPAFKNPILDLDPATVANEIKTQAESDWVDDYEMQDYQIENQTAAYNELKAVVVDTEVKQTQMDKAMSDWDMDFEMIQYQYENQMEAYEN
ncbi:MAG: hypothetical protein ACE3JQ_00070 [Paenisporosarcina sp.]